MRIKHGPGGHECPPYRKLMRFNRRVDIYVHQPEPERRVDIYVHQPEPERRVDIYVHHIKHKVDIHAHQVAIT